MPHEIGAFLRCEEPDRRGDQRGNLIKAPRAARKNAFSFAKARSLGSRVLVPPTRHGDSVIAVVSDPEGHPLGLCT